MTAQTRTPTRTGSLPAVLLGVLAVLASLLVAPAGPAAAGQAPALGHLVVRGAAPAGVRDGREHQRTHTRRGTRDRTTVLAATRQHLPGGHGPAPAPAVLATAALLATAVAGGLAAGGRSGPPSWRTPGGHPGRAPPAPAIA